MNKSTIIYKKDIFLFDMYNHIGNNVSINRNKEKQMNFKFRDWKVIRSSILNDKSCKWVAYHNGNLIRTFPTKQKAIQFVNISIMVGETK